LRTPLTSIKGWVITLQDNNTDKETFKLGFNILEKETDRLSNMVEELLDFSRLINGKMQLKIEKINIM
ncbi:histidine kinase dimerization/phospho-acceptor domain-containing protein, partial [Clostridium sp. ZBS12]